MNFSIINKIIKIFIQRPTQFWSYFRQTYFFFQTYFLRKIFLNSQAQLSFGKNVRLQAIKSLIAEPTAFIQIGANSIIYEHARIEAYATGKIKIGESSIIGDARISSRAEISIGKNFLTSWNVFIQDFDAHPVAAAERILQVDAMTENFYPSFQKSKRQVISNFDFSSAKIIIGDNVWVGANVSILKGAHVGDNCVIATGSVVLKGVYPANCILAGNPAKVAKIIS